MRKTKSLYGHFDIEADGPTPSTSNMINIGIVFTNDIGDVVKEFVADLRPRIGFNGDADTLQWWLSDSNRTKEYNRIMEEGIDPMQAMGRLDKLLKEITQSVGVLKIIWAARPAAYDWMFLKNYWDMYRVKNKEAFDIGFSATCLSTIREVWKEFSGLQREQIDEYFKKWTKDMVMTHNGLDDARYQARIYHGITNELKEMAAKYRQTKL